MGTRQTLAVVLRALRRQQGAERCPPHGDRSWAVTEWIALYAAPIVPCTAACGREADAGSRAARDPSLAWRFAQPTTSGWRRSGHRVTRRPSSAERGPHGSGGHEADAGIPPFALKLRNICLHLPSKFEPQTASTAEHNLVYCLLPIWVTHIPHRRESRALAVMQLAHNTLPTYLISCKPFIH